MILKYGSIICRDSSDGIVIYINLKPLNMKLKDYPKEIQDLIVKRVIDELYDMEDPVTSFTWYKSEEGRLLWQEVYNGNLQPFYDKYPVPDTREKK